MVRPYLARSEVFAVGDVNDLLSLVERFLISVINDRRSRAPRISKVREVPEGTFLIGEELCFGSHQPEPRSKVYFSAKECELPVAVTGASGTGKTTLTIPAFIARKGSRILVDFRGDLVHALLAALCDAGFPSEKICLIDLGQEDFVVPLNILAGLGAPHTTALHLADLIERKAELGVQTVETLRCGLVACAEQKRSLLELEPLFTNAVFRAEVMATIKDPYARSFFQRFESLSPDRKAGFWLPVANKLQAFLSYPTIRAALGASTCLDFRRLIDTDNQIVLISLCGDRLHSAAALAGMLLLSCIQDAIFSRVDIPQADRLPFHLFCDEWENLCTEDFHSLICESRRFGGSLWLAFQNLDQIPPKLRALLRNNAAAKVMFNTGALDASELASEVTGVTREQARSAILALQTGEAIVVKRGQRSVRVRVTSPKRIEVDDARLAAYRSEALASYGRPWREVNTEIDARNTANSGRSSSGSPTGPCEVRHNELPRFRRKAK